MNWEVMEIKEYSTFSKASELQRHHQIQFSVTLNCIFRTLVESVLPLSRDAVGVFYSPSRLGLRKIDKCLLLTRNICTIVLLCETYVKNIEI